MKSISNLDPQNRVDLNINEYAFLNAFKNVDERLYFRLVKEGTNTAKNEDCLLSLTADEYPLMQKIFQKYQKQGFAIYFVVNSGGQRKEEITRIAAHFLDMDFGKVPKLDESGKIIKSTNGKIVYEYRSTDQIEKFKQDFINRLKNFSLAPNIINETKNGFHIYWLVGYQDQEALLRFRPLQKVLTAYFGQYEFRKEHADESVSNLPKVMRMPNYEHLKDPLDPFTISCIYFSDHARYTQNDVAKAINIDLTKLEINAVTIKDLKKQSIEPKHLHHAVVQSKSSRGMYDQYKNIIGRLRSIDLRQFLNIDCSINVNFKCIFHDDKSPSAAIGCKDGVYKYFCNSHNCDYHKEEGLDIIDIIEMQKNCSTSEAINYLVQHFNLADLDSKWVLDQKQKITNNIELLEEISNNQSTYKHLNRILQYAYPYILEILNIGSKHITTSNYNIKGDHLFFFSNRYLSNRVNKRLDKTNWYINLFCVLGLLNKIKDEYIDDTLFQKAKYIAEQKNEYRICFYTIPKFRDILNTAEERAELMIKCGFSIKGMSRKYVENIFGECFANDIYSIKIDCSVNNKLIHDYIESFIHRKVFEECGYFCKDMILTSSIILNGRRISKNSLEFEYRRCLPKILQKHNLLIAHANKEIASKYNINVHKRIIIKNS